MRLHFRKANIEEINLALSLLKQAAETLKEKGVNQWGFWINPNEDKINWVKEGFYNNEFFFAENSNSEIVGMFRLLEQDELYWGIQPIKANYIHSLVVDKKFAGKNIGKLMMSLIENLVINKGILNLRLDCNASNPVLCNYYEKLNLIKVGEKQMPHSLNNLYEKNLLSDFPLRLLIGNWKGKGRGMYPTIKKFDYEEVLKFEFITEKQRIFYLQRADFENSNELVHMESGFITHISGNKYELNNSQSGGRNEILSIEVIESKTNFVKLQMTQLSISNDKKGLVRTEREFIIDHDQLSYKHYMQTETQLKQLHLEAKLKRH